MQRQNIGAKNSGLAKASIILGLLSVLLINFLVISVPLGALAVTFALLTRNHDNSFSRISMAGLLTGLLGMTVSAAMAVYSLKIAIDYYGSFDAFILEVNEYTQAFLESAGYSL